MAKKTNKPSTPETQPADEAPATSPAESPAQTPAEAPIEATAPATSLEVQTSETPVKAEAEPADAAKPKQGDLVVCGHCTIEGATFTEGTILGYMDKGIPKPTKEAMAKGVTHGHLVARLRMKTIAVIKGA